MTVMRRCTPLIYTAIPPRQAPSLSSHMMPRPQPYNAKLQHRAFRAKLRAFRAKLRAFRAKLRAFRVKLRAIWCPAPSHMVSSSEPFEPMQYQAAGSWSRSLKVGSSHYKRYKQDPLSPEVHLPHDIYTVNMSSTCDICGRTFAKPFNLRRHEREVHGHISNDHDVLMSTHAVLQHPFTCIVAGCTQSGKTVWVKTFGESSENDMSTSSTHNLVLWGMATI